MKLYLSLGPLPPAYTHTCFTVLGGTEENEVETHGNTGDKQKQEAWRRHSLPVCPSVPQSTVIHKGVLQ